MSKGAASEELMGQLHTRVAKIMLGTLNRIEKAQELHDLALQMAQDSGDAEQLLGTVLERPDVSPALLSAITKFLSDNKITCNPAESEELSGLGKRLAEKRAKHAVGNVVPMVPPADD